MDREILSDLLIAGKGYVVQWRGEIFALIEDYFKASGDRASKPSSVMLDIIQSIENPNFVLIVHETAGVPDGFLIGKKVASVGRILMAFLGKGLDNKSIIRLGLEMFDGWAKERGCDAADIYTHRHPKSYRSLAQYGWRHNYTVYRKEYNP